MISKYNFPMNFNDKEISEITKKIMKCIVSGETILSENVLTFEREFSEYLNIGHAVGCNSGTDALILALKALEVGEGDEVIIPANTFYATAAAVALVGATPVLCDVDEKTFLIKHEDIKEKISSKTKAVIAVHLYGNVCDMESISSVCRDNGIYFIEDCAQAHGAKRNDINVGTLSNIACFSFHPSKNLPASGDAGICVTKSQDLDKTLRVLRMLGQSSQNVHELIGLNSRLDEIQAIVLSTGLKKLDKWNAKRRKNAEYYKRALFQLPIEFQQYDESVLHSFHLFQIKVDQSDRDDLFNYLFNDKGIEVVIRYPTPIHLQSAFKYLGYKEGDFPNAEKLSKSLICLPINPHLSHDELNNISGSIKAFFSARNKV